MPVKLIDTLINGIPDSTAPQNDPNRDFISDCIKILSSTADFYKFYAKMQSDLKNKYDNTKFLRKRMLSKIQKKENTAAAVFLGQVNVADFTIEQRMLFIIACAANEDNIRDGWEYLKQLVLNHNVLYQNSIIIFIEMMKHESINIEPNICMYYLEQLAILVEEKFSQSELLLDCSKTILTKYAQHNPATRFKSALEFDKYWHCAIGVCIQVPNKEKLQVINLLKNSLTGSPVEITSKRSVTDIYKALQINMTHLQQSIQPNSNINELTKDSELKPIEVANNDILSTDALEMSSDQSLVALVKNPKLDEPWAYQFSDRDTAEIASLYFLCLLPNCAVTWHILKPLPVVVEPTLPEPAQNKTEPEFDLKQFNNYKHRNNKKWAASCTKAAIKSAGLVLVGATLYYNLKPKFE